MSSSKKKKEKTASSLVKGQKSLHSFFGAPSTNKCGNGNGNDDAVSNAAAVVVQTLFAPRMIVPLAYDSGGVTTSTVTVPLVAALGLGMAENVPGRSVLIDGFGLIAFASLFPMITVMGYAQLAEWFNRRKSNKVSSPTKAT